MTDLRLSQLPDGDLEDALRGLVRVIDWPAASAPVTDEPVRTDLAAIVRMRLETQPRPTSRWTWRPARRALILALVALLALAAIAGAVGFGLPGLRLLFGPAPVSPPPTLEPISSPSPVASASGSAATAAPGASAADVPGASMGLGEQVELADLDARAGFHVRWPSDPSLGPPDAAYIDAFTGDQVTLVWASRPDLPATLEPGVGLLLSQFRGQVEEGFFTKALDGGTSVERLPVGDGRGFWLTGDLHFIFWKGPNGFVDDSRRWVGDVLLWADGDITYRLETSLGRERAVDLAESIG
jgi:hypothetical protein